MIERFNEYLWWNTETKQMEVDIPIMLRKLELPDTPETREEAMQVVCKVMREMYPDASQDVHTIEYGTKRVYNPTKK